MSICTSVADLKRLQNRAFPSVAPTFFAEPNPYTVRCVLLLPHPSNRARTRKTLRSIFSWPLLGGSSASTASLCVCLASRREQKPTGDFLKVLVCPTGIYWNIGFPSMQQQLSMEKAKNGKRRVTVLSRERKNSFLGRKRWLWGSGAIPVFWGGI